MVRLKMFSVMVMILVLGSGVHGQTLEKESLKGLKGVHVKIAISVNLIEDGLKKSSVQTDVELKLRMADIKVLTKEEYLKEPGIPSLNVTVNCLKWESLGSYALCIGVELKQAVLLLRDVKIMCFATTWSTGATGIIGAKDVNTYIRDIIKDKVDIFINDYLAVNTKE